MNKCLMVAIIALGLTSCTPKDAHYYQTHPQKLQQAIRACPENHPQGMSCDDLQQLARKMNSLAYQLQQSPQGFGMQIIALQSKLSKLQEELEHSQDKNSLLEQRQKIEETLAQYLAVVKWLEAPVS